MAVLQATHVWLGAEISGFMAVFAINMCCAYPPGLDKIKTLRARSLNIFKLSVKVHKLRQGNLRQKVCNLRNQEN